MQNDKNMYTKTQHKCAVPSRLYLCLDCKMHLLKTKIVAFQNSYLGGSIYIGVDDDGQVFETTEEERDLMESKIINWIRDEAIFPNCSEYI